MAKLTVYKPAPHLPAAGLSAPTNGYSAQTRAAEPRKLSAKQKKNPFLRAAFKRLSEIADPHKRGTHLRRLDTVHKSGRRMRSEVWRSLAKITEPLLVRVDIATLCCGYLDEDSGAFKLNTQRGIAQDAGLSDWQLTRLFQMLDGAGYTVRRRKAIWVAGPSHGVGLIKTRTMILFTPLFFRDLGLGWMLERAQTAAQKRRKNELIRIAAQKVQRERTASDQKVHREMRRARYQERSGGSSGSGGPAAAGDVLNKMNARRNPRQADPDPPDQGELPLPASASIDTALVKAVGLRQAIELSRVAKGT